MRTTELSVIQNIICIPYLQKASELPAGTKLLALKKASLQAARWSPLKQASLSYGRKDVFIWAIVGAGEE